jgi:hypothetical protein
VSLNATAGVINPGNGGGTIPKVRQNDCRYVLGRVDELTDGTGGSVDAVMGAAIGPYRKSRLRKDCPMSTVLIVLIVLLLLGGGGGWYYGGPYVGGGLGSLILLILIILALTGRL